MPLRELLRGLIPQAPMRTLRVVMPREQPAHRPRVVPVMERLQLRALAPQRPVEPLVLPVLPRTPRINVPARHAARRQQGADSNMIAHNDITMPDFAGNDLDPLMGYLVFGPHQIFGDQFVEPAVNIADKLCGQGVSFRPFRVKPLSIGDVCLSLKLEVAHFRVLAVVALECSLDTNKMSIVPLDQVAVIAIHRAHEVCQ